MKLPEPGQMQAVRVNYSVTHLGGGATSAGVAFPGGLDQTTPSLRLQPGALRDCLNFECAQSGGYARVEGYERFSGLPAPSGASYEIVQLASFVNVPAVGAVVTQGDELIIPPGNPEIFIPQTAIAKPPAWNFNSAHVDSSWSALWAAMLFAAPAWEGAGQTLTDLVTGETATNNHADTNPVTWVSDTYGLALQGSGQYGQFGSSFSFRPQSAGSVNASVTYLYYGRFPALPGSGYLVAAKAYNDTATADGGSLGIKTIGSQGSTDNGLNPGDQSANNIVTGFVAGDNALRAYGVSYDYATNICYVYINGALQGSYSFTPCETGPNPTVDVFGGNVEAGCVLIASGVFDAAFHAKWAADPFGPITPIILDSLFVVQNAAGVSVQGSLTIEAGATASGTVVATVTGTTPYLVLTDISGVFNTSGTLVTAAPLVVGKAVPTTVSISAQLAAQYTADAADIHRASIAAVPGGGNVLGVVAMTFSGADNVYAFRATMDGMAVALYKASAAGWVLVPFFNLVSFTGGGTAVPLDGDTLTQGSVRGTIKRVMWQSGAWTGTAVGQFVVTTPTGGNFSAGSAVTSSGATVTLTGMQSAISLLPGGRFEFVKCNFSGQAITRRIYGCDGVNKCFEFDGETLAPITTGLSPDQPSHIAFHKNYLFISQQSSIFYCGPGLPFKWGSVDGGGEIATGDTVTNMLTLPGSQNTATLGVFLLTNTAFLYGTDPTTFNFVLFDAGLGAIPYTAQNLFDTFVFDNLGVVTLRTTLNWGNFLPSTLTKNILPFILQERAKISASTVNRDKSQYRVFFSDGYGLWLTMVNQQYLGAAVVSFPNPVFCIDDDQTSNQTHVTYFGASDGLGYVYQMESGTSFDGAAINAYIVLAWDAIKSPRILKRFRAASIEIQGTGYASIQFGYKLGYGSSLIGQPDPVAYATSFTSAPRWDSFTWDNFTWDGATLSPTDVGMTGTGENVQVTISSMANYMPAFTVDSVIYHYTPRRGIRV